MRKLIDRVLSIYVFACDLFRDIRVEEIVAKINRSEIGTLTIQGCKIENMFP